MTDTPKPPDERLLAYARPQTRVKVASRRRINLHVTGEGSPTVLLLNGLGGTTLSFTLAPGEHASVVVLDLRGRPVRRLWTGIGTGDSQSAAWDGRSDQGWIAPAGVYFARVEGEAGRSSEQKLIITH